MGLTRRFLKAIFVMLLVFAGFIGLSYVLEWFGVPALATIRQDIFDWISWFATGLFRDWISDYYTWFAITFHALVPVFCIGLNMVKRREWRYQGTMVYLGVLTVWSAMILWNIFYTLVALIFLSDVVLSSGVVLVLLGMYSPVALLFGFVFLEATADIFIYLKDCWNALKDYNAMTSYLVSYQGEGSNDAILTAPWQVYLPVMAR